MYTANYKFIKFQIYKMCLIKVVTQTIKLEMMLHILIFYVSISIACIEVKIFLD